MESSIEREWFSVKSAAAYSDFTTRTIETAIRLGKLKSKSVHLQGSRSSRRIKREWIDAWIEGMPVSGIEDGQPPVVAKEPEPATLAEQIAREVVRLMREA